MHSHTAEVLRPGFLVEPQQMIGIELMGFPGWNHIFESDLGWMTVGLHVILVLFVALDIHVACIPVSIFDGRLRSPMRPDPKLGIAIPIRNLPVPKRLACSLEWSRNNFQIWF